MPMPPPAPGRPEAPRVSFPGGYIQILNPRYPIESVWSDLLHLDPGAQLPAHVHHRTSSLLVCLSGVGEALVDGAATALRPGVCVFVPAGAVHAIRSSAEADLRCLSMNQGIIEPGVGADLEFADTMDAATASRWSAFDQECARVSAEFRRQLTSSLQDSLDYRVEV